MEKITKFSLLILVWALSAHFIALAANDVLSIWSYFAFGFGELH
jgi:hypothetical protein